MFCSFCSKDGAKCFCPCRQVWYCGKQCQTAHWGSHKAQHKNFFALLAKAKEVRRESAEEIMRNPMLRDVEVRVGSDVKTGRIFQYNPEDGTYEVMLGKASPDGMFIGRGSTTVHKEDIRFCSYLLDLVYGATDEALREEIQKAWALDSMELNGGSVGTAGHAPQGAWQVGQGRMQSQFMDVHAWTVREDGEIYDNISMFAPHTCGDPKYVRKEWSKEVDDEYNKFILGIKRQINKVASEAEMDGIDVDEWLEEAQSELEMQPLTCWRVALLEKRKLSGKGRLCIGSFGIRIGGSDSEVMWVHGNGADSSAKFEEGTAKRALNSGGGIAGPNGKFYPYCK